jgi:hypothetical protein
LAEGRLQGGEKTSGWALAQLAVLGWTALLLALVVGATFAQTNGEFTYSLDDPYIHLSMAEQIRAGEYGVNAGEPAAASSSILYPFLLAGMGWAGDYAPLIVNVLALFAAAGLTVAVWRDGVGPAPLSTVGRIVLTGVVVLLLANMVGLALTGMEHMLHVALTVAALLGAVRLVRTERPDPWWLAVLIIEPAIRYEGLAVSLAGAAVLILHGRRFIGLGVLAAAAAIPLAFAYFLVSQGLPPLPSSVLVKGSEVAGAGGALAAVGALVENFTANATDRAGIVMLTLAIMAAVVARRPPKEAEQPVAQVASTVGLFAAVLLFAHLVAGRFGWAQRYEAYALTTALAALPVLFPLRMKIFLENRDRAGFAVAGVLTFLAFEPNVAATLESGAGSRNIYLQQRQMHRFAVGHLKAPVAVNDLGWVSYRNPHYVLDLWGLGSERARRARAASPDVQWMDDLARERGVRVAMVYDRWIPETPSNWVRLGVLTFRGTLVSAAEREVAFYATSLSNVAPAKAALAAWTVGLPRRATFIPEADIGPLSTP